MPQRFRKTFKESFFGDFIYSMAIPEDHFLVQAVAPWQALGLAAPDKRTTKEDDNKGIWLKLLADPFYQAD